MRIVTPIGAALMVSLAAVVFAQTPPPNLPSPGGYNAIPNFTGTEAGLQFRDALNDRFSGVQSISPKIESVPFANLAPEQDGLVVYCVDCQRTLPCTAGGTGAWAFGTGGQWQCNTPVPQLKFDGTDNLGPMNGSRTNEKNILDFGATASTTRINCNTIGGQSNITCSGIASADFALNQYVALYGAGAAPTVAQPTGLVAQPTTTTNNISATTHFTRLAQGCTVQNAVAWCTAGSATCQVSNVSFYEAGQAISIAGAGAAGAALATSIAGIDDAGNAIVLSAPAATSVNGGAITGANCTTTRRYQAVAIDSNGGWSTPTSILTVSNTASALNWGNWVDIQVNVPQPPNSPTPTYPLPSNIPVAFAFYCGEGSNPLILCGVEVPTYSFEYNSSFPAPWNDQLIGGSLKGFPSIVTFHDVGRPYGHDLIQGTTPPTGAVNRILLARILSINGTTVQLSAAPAQSGTFSMGHDNGPNINQAIQAACDTNYRCGTVYTPYSANFFPVATPIVAQRGVGLRLLGGGGPVGAEPGSVGSSSWLWTGALGGTMLLLNQEAITQIDNLALQADIGTTMGVAIDTDGFDPGDGLGQPVTTTRPTYRDIYTGQASVGIRLSNINSGNGEFGVVESSTINGVYGATFNSGSSIGMLFNSGNALGTRLEGVDILGNIGIWSNGGGFYAVQTETGQNDGVGVWFGNGSNHPITIETTRNEHLSRALYSAGTGAASGTQINLRGDTYTDMRVPLDGDFIALAGGAAGVLTGNEFLLGGFGVDNDTTTSVFPSGVVFNTGGGLESHGNFWSNICADPFANILFGPVNTSGEMCINSAGTATPIPPYSRGSTFAGVGPGFQFGVPTGGDKGNGSLNLAGAVYVNGSVMLDSSGNLGAAKQGGVPAAAGAGSCRIFIVAGTNAGSCKAQMICGTSTTPVTLVDNVGSGC